MKLVLLRSDSNNPYCNLAIEEMAFHRITEDKDTLLLYLWINRPSVIIGMHQNPYVECDLERMKNDDVLLVRRKTGGGAVYHDLGNLNYTIIADDDYADKEKWDNVICDAIMRYGLDCRFSGRNDLLVDDTKVSGAAYLHDGNIYLQHGSILVNVDMDELKAVLTPDRSKLEKHGICSVGQRVSNLFSLCDTITVDGLAKSIRQTMTNAYSFDVIEEPPIREYIDFSEVDSLAREYSSKKFLYGKFTNISDC